MINFIGKIAGRLFLFYCKRWRLISVSESTDLQIELQRLKAANAIMRQQLKKQKIRPSFSAKCRMIRFTLKFGISRRKIEDYLPISRTTISKFIKQARENIFQLIPKRNRLHSSPRKTSPEIVKIVRTMKANNPAWGYLRIAIHLWNLHIFISPSTVRRILLKPESYPEKNKKRFKEIKTLRTITASKPNSLWSLDLTTLRLFGIFHLHVLGVIDHYSRKVFCLSSTVYPTTDWIKGECNKLFTDFGKPKRIISDNGSQFTAKGFRKFMEKEGVRHIRTSYRHPQSNGKIERFFQSLKQEFLCLFILKSKKQLDGLLGEYLLYYNQYRLHEAIDGQAPDRLYYGKPLQKPPKCAKRIRAPIEELHFGNGLLKAYQYKKAA